MAEQEAYSEDSPAAEGTEASDSAFVVDLDFFEGPIELLLQLVKKTKIPIMEVHLADITDAYLSEIKARGVLDMDNASEFITVATILIEIKAKSMLPDITDYIPEDVPVYSPETLLKLQMQKYALFKEASEKLKVHEEVNMLFKAPDEGAHETRVVLSESMDIDSLLDAFAKMLSKAEVAQKVVAPRQIIKDRFTVAEKIIAIEDAVKIRGEMEFEELFDADYARVEIITTFQALLELLKLQRVRVRQEEIFGKIYITYRGASERQNIEVTEDIINN